MEYTCIAHRRVLCCPHEVGRNETRQLYAVAYEKPQRGKWVPEIDYLHGISAGEARWWFCQSDSPQVMSRIRIVGVAPVIAYFANDEHGDDVSV